MNKLEIADPDPYKAAARPFHQHFIYGGELGALVRSKDWSKTSLGPMEGWPHSLFTAVSLCLSSNFPISIIWGPGHVHIYNDAYIAICGYKHPHALGQDFRQSWVSAWPVIGKAFESALQGKAAYLEDQRMFLDRNGFLEETFFTFSFGPIWDESGNVAGIFHPVTETTYKMLNDRRLRMIKDIAFRAVKEHTVEEAGKQVVKTLAEYDLDLPFVLLYLLDKDAKEAHLIEAAGLATGFQASPKIIDLRAEFAKTWPLKFSLETGKVKLVEDLTGRFGEVHCGPYPALLQRAMVIPLNAQGLARPLGFIVAGVSTRLPWDNRYREFFEMFGNSVSAVMSTPYAYQEERKRAEALGEIDRVKTAFFSNISHEFRTPLTMMLEPLEDNLNDTSMALSSKHREREKLAYRNSLRLLKLVNSLLDFSRIEAGRMKAYYRPTDLGKLTADIASVFRSAIEKAGLKFTVDTANVGDGVYVDREMWEKIVLNLLSNALKFTFKGEIEIRLRKLDEDVSLMVRDTGHGIPEDELPNLFERYHPVDSAPARTFGRSGIGLSLTRDLVKLHGGKISVKSKVGEGTQFLVEVPLGTEKLQTAGGGRIADESLPSYDSLESLRTAFVEEARPWTPDEKKEESPVVQEKAYEWPRPRIIIADDNADMCSYLKNVLGPEWDILTVTDGEAVLESVAERPPDIFLLDVLMPNLDGFQLLKKLKENPRTKNIPVVLLSARTDVESRIMGLEAGAEDYIIKPFSSNELRARLRTHLQIGRLRAEAERQHAKMLAIFMQAPIAICVLDGPEHLFTLANPLFEQFVQAKVMGKKFAEVFGPGDLCGASDLLESVYSSGESYVGKQTPLTIFDSNGKPQLHYVDFGCHPLRNSQQQMMGILALFYDVTEQILARKALEEANNLIQFALESAKMGEWELDIASGNVLRTLKHDQCFGHGELKPVWTIEDSLKQVHPEEREKVYEDFQKSLKCGVAEWNVECRVVWPDQSVHWVASRAHTKFDCEGKPLRMCGIIWDITEKKLAEEALCESLRSRDEFMSLASHELKTPITSMKLQLQIAGRQFRPDHVQTSTPEKFSKLMVEVQKQVDRLNKLIDELLDVTRIQAGKLTFEFEEVDVEEIVQEVLGRFSDQIKEAGCKIEVNIAPKLKAQWDRSRMDQVFSNLLSNCVKYAPNSLIQILVSAKGEYANIIVQDFGPGIDKEHLGSIFGRFERAKSARSIGGLGLGLYIVKQIVLGHHGTIVVESEEGKGAKFIIDLPLVAGTAILSAG